MAERPPCRCLLKEANPDLGTIVADYVSSLPEDAKAPDDLYRRRLDACQICDRLADGMCLDCGCYVEARAAKQKQRCPHVPPLWEG
ncbi:MAG: hypothetical protein E7319_11140 [Clostridiales bacterium]|nr:hypothetical protein [Clostridiales bacterium]